MIRHYVTTVAEGNAIVQHCKLCGYWVSWVPTATGREMMVHDFGNPAAVHVVRPARTQDEYREYVERLMRRLQAHYTGATGPNVDAERELLLAHIRAEHEVRS